MPPGWSSKSSRLAACLQFTHEKAYSWLRRWRVIPCGYSASCCSFGLGIQVLALTLAPISIVQAVAACGITLFLVLSHFILGERLTRVEYLGIAAILASLLLLGLSVNASDNHVSGSASLAGIFGISVPAMIVGVTLFLLTDRINAATPRRAHLKAPLFGLSSGLLYGTGALALKEVSTIVKHHGLVDGVPRVLASPGLYLYLISTCLGFLVFQTALQRTMASVFVPVNNVTSSAFFIVLGTMLFHEHLPSAETPFLLRLGSFALILVGLVILAFGKRSTAPEEPTVPVEEEPGAPPVGCGSAGQVAMVAERSHPPAQSGGFSAAAGSGDRKCQPKPRGVGGLHSGPSGGPRCERRVIHGASCLWSDISAEW